MYKKQKVCVVIPCHNEEIQIKGVIENIPEFVDKIVIVDDKSKDQTIDVVNKCLEANHRIHLICLEKNQGCGGALAAGYKWARDHDFDLAVRMDGDGQMNPVNLPALLDPVVSNGADYSKGNRLFTGEAFTKIP
ncbi:MAG: glycosyltransferase family 2 protein, partial [Desulfobacula sp.]|nr:glycosyltransferase family 2 protein [Desulfobacula sp.]